MRKLPLFLALAIGLAATATASAQTANLFQPAQQADAGSSAQPNRNATATNTATVPAGGSQVLPNGTRQHTTQMRNVETCIYTLEKLVAGRQGVQIQKSANSMKATRRDTAATYVTTCTPDGLLVQQVAIGNGAVPPPTTITNPPRGGGGGRDTITPVARQNQR